MNHARRLTLVVALLALAGQTFLTAAYLLWFLPVFSGGIGPDDAEGSGGGSALPVLVSLGSGAAVGALHLWSLRGVARALSGGAPGARPFLVAGVVQLLILAGAWAVDLTPLAATAALSLPLLLAGFLTERRHVRRG
ncbi:hypothetical protein ACFWIN_24935 [Streptomyces sp. NPDC127049]|uniref:hypothetical protein n=1 Tax=Streptomyces sp. NPDC127049 TaxID=3347118 RepID=UPI003658577C